MHQQARLSEIFDQILQNTPVLGFGSRTPPFPPPRKWNSSQSPSQTLPRTPPPTENEILPRVQVTPYPEHLTQKPPSPRKFKTLIFFFVDSKSDLTQNTTPPPPTPSQIQNNFNFLSRFQIWPYREYHPPPKLKSLIFFPEFKSDLSQNPPLPRKLKTLTEVKIIIKYIKTSSFAQNERSNKCSPDCGD